MSRYRCGPDPAAIPLVTDRGTPLDHEGLQIESPSAITTWSGAKVDVLDANPEDIWIADIAHALARICRYGGHVTHHLSVARHSIWVSRALDNAAPGLALWGLLHDATEAYLGDMVKPLKHHPSMQLFRDAEDRLEAVIAERFGLVHPMPAEVKEADRLVTVEYEIGTDQRWKHQSAYELDETDFMTRYRELLGWR